MVKDREWIERYHPDRWECLVNIHSDDDSKGLDDLRRFDLSGLISSPNLQIKVD